MRIYRLLLTTGLLLWLWVPQGAWGANGEGCNTDITQFTQPAGGMVKPFWCVSLLDDISSASGGPVVFDLGLRPPTTLQAGSAVGGLPDAITFEVGTDDDCTAGTVTITTSEVRGGAESNLAAPNPTLDVDTSSPAGATKININLHDVPIGPFLNLRWSGVAGCTGGFDILGLGYETSRR